ncbi:hypothetical protein CC80DRAFT_374271, partial [Byssothecium circinans]
EGKYNGAYLTLYNDEIRASAARFVPDDTLNPDEAQVGAVTWSAGEKTMFFAALERLGKDDLPGISAAIGIKSMPEVRQFLLSLQEAPFKRTVDRGDSKMRVTLQDIPAALEIEQDCEDQLEVAGEALAWYQEIYEMKQEQARYGDHWLITPELAERLEEALKPQLGGLASLPTTTDTEDEKPQKAEKVQVPEPQILQDIPEAKLINTTELLNLSKNFFMNPHPTVSYPWPHWTELVVEQAREPSVYRTAFTDFHALVISLTRRLVQAALIQATSRMRSQGWRSVKGLKPYVKPGDVLSAIDLLGMERNSDKRWAGVARRCGLQVEDRQRGAQGNGSRRKVPWDEVERVLTTEDPGSLNTSGTDDVDFKVKAMRSETPRPTARLSLVSSDGIEPTMDALEEELKAVEAFDQAASQRAQAQLCDVLDLSTPIKKDSPEAKEEKTETKPPRNRFRLPSPSDNWRKWTRYRAEWEELRESIPESEFSINKK